MARILITDDAAFMRMMIKNILTQNGHEVVGEAANGREALERFAALKPDVCTMDITMPELDGISALKGILEQDPAARVVMCSALGQEAKVIESIRAGAKDFIVKPFQPDRVLSAITKALG
jgi:two-component system chemotaxis response regulator CheY